MPTVCSTKAKVLRHPKGKKEQFAPPKKRYKAGTKIEVAAHVTGGFDYPTQLLGATPDGRGTVYFDPSLGSEGEKNARDVLSALPQVIAWHDQVFGFRGGNFNVIIAAVNGATDGGGGAYHYGCDFSSGADLYESAAFGNSPLVVGLVAAELSEAYMGPNQSLGQSNPTPWGCGDSMGEGLSRRCADEIVALIGSPNAMDPYSAASSWDGSDYVNVTEQTDQDYVSTGCTMVALDWLIANGYPLHQIAQTPAGTLANVYAALTGDSPDKFLAKLTSAWKGTTVTNDYPFTGHPDPTGAAGGTGPTPGPDPKPSPGGSPAYTGTFDLNARTITLVPVNSSNGNNLFAELKKIGLTGSTLTALVEMIADIARGADDTKVWADFLTLFKTL